MANSLSQINVLPPGRIHLPKLDKGEEYELFIYLVNVYCCSWSPVFSWSASCETVLFCADSRSHELRYVERTRERFGLNLAKTPSIQQRKHDHLLHRYLLHNLGKHLTIALFIWKRNCMQWSLWSMTELENNSGKFMQSRQDIMFTKKKSHCLFDLKAQSQF